uniref:Uncharacterized protein n=1 Tax=Caenorhabditis japonica TaxID=281687 RepID=A0A8R1DSR4_CAEJA
MFPAKAQRAAVAPRDNAVSVLRLIAYNISTIRKRKTRITWHINGTWTCEYCSDKPISSLCHYRSFNYVLLRTRGQRSFKTPAMSEQQQQKSQRLIDFSDICLAIESIFLLAFF